MTSPIYVIEPGIGVWRRAHVAEDGFPDGLEYLSSAEYDATGAMFDARVTKVDATLDLAFVDLGNGRQGVMNFRRARLLRKGRVHAITDCVTEGERLKVQAVTDPQGAEGKAIPVTPRPKLIGRYCVVEMAAARLNFSKDLKPSDVHKLKVAGIEDLSADAAIVVRGRSAEVDAEIVVTEAERLVSALADPVGGPALVFHYSLAEKALLDLDDTDYPVIIEGRTAAAELKALAHKQYPELVDRIMAARREEEPVFDHFGIDEAIEEALADRIELPSGGWVSIHPTPALTAIDVNMGQAYKSNDAAEAKLAVNQEAALAIAYHLRFQNIGGLVVVDFIDLTGKGRIQTLMDTLKSALADDPVSVQMSGISAFGLVQLNRARRGVSLRDRLQVIRPAVMRTEAIAFDLVRKGLRLGEGGDTGYLEIRAPEGLVQRFKDDLKGMIVALEDRTSRAVKLITGPAQVRLKDD